MNIKPEFNPFQIGGPIRDPIYLAGRKKNLQEISSAMLNLQNISLRGERRTGKTSLLRYLAHPESISMINLPKNHIPVYFDFQGYAKASIVNVWQAIIESIAYGIKERHSNGTALSKEFLAATKEFFSFSNLPTMFGTGLGRALANLDLNGNRIKVHLLLDEFDQTIRNPDLDDSFYDDLRSLPTRAGNISYIIATRTGLAALQPTINKVSSPLFNIFTTIVLHPFEEEEVYRLIFDYFSQTEFDISLAERLCNEASFLYDITGFHPYFLQTICYHLFARLDEPDWPLGKAQHEALLAFEQDAEPHFRFFWKISSPEEQELIRDLTYNQSIDWEKNDIIVQVKKLRERCLVVQAKRTEDGWRLFSSIFGKWVKDFHSHSTQVERLEADSKVIGTDREQALHPPEQIVPNPFLIGGPVLPEYFIGRTSLIRTSYNGLAGRVRSSIAVSGERGLGKTSLLYYLRYTAQEQQWDPANIYIYLYCRDLERFTPNRFYHRILDRLKLEKDDDFLLQTGVQELLARTEVNFRDFRRFLRRLKQHNFRLVLLLDGFGWIIRTETADQTPKADFLSQLRSLTNDPDFALTMLITTREPLNVLCRDIVRDRPESEFYNGFVFQTLTPFTSEEIDTLLTQALRETDVEFNQADRDFLRYLAGAHPALLQIAASLLFEEHQTGSLNKQIYKRIILSFEQRARNFFTDFWFNSSSLEQTLIILIILGYLSERTSTQLELTPYEMERLLQRYENVLIHLAERGLVQETEETYQIFSVIFAWWLIRDVNADHMTTLINHYGSVGDILLQRIWQTFEKIASQVTLDMMTQQLKFRESRPVDSRFTARYQTQEELGRGAFSVIYKAYDIQLERVVAIKRLQSHPDIPIGESSNRLLKEARAASKLQHSNIVTLYDVVEEQEQIFLVMEYLEGQTLADRLQEKEPIALEQITDWLEQIASALDYAHAQGVIHRDIKPANLMITNEGIVKFTDFGIAKVIGHPGTTQDSELKGTLQYMSPEQVNQESPDNRSDLFSLAAVALEMLSGASPWTGKDYIALMKQISAAPPRSLTEYKIPNASIFDPIFQKALAKNPDDRYQNGHDFVQALRSAASVT